MKQGKFLALTHTATVSCSDGAWGGPGGRGTPVAFK